MEEVEFSKPVHIQRLEQALKLDPFLNYVQNVINQPISDVDTASESEPEGAVSIKNGITRTKEERENDKSHLFNFEGLRKKRYWLKEVLIDSDSDDDNDDSEFTQEYLENMLREHRLRKHDQSHFYQNEDNRGYLYYSSGLLSRVDKFPEHQRFMAGSRRKKNKEKREKEKLKKIKKEEEEDEFDVDSPLAQNEDSLHSFPDDASDDLTIPLKGRSRGSKKDKKPKKLDAQALAMRRHKLWVLMAKKEVGRCQKSKASLRKEVLQNCKRIATGCMRVCRQKALQSQKSVKDKVWMLKRLTRTMQAEWKKFDRILKEQNRRAEREAEEQRKMDKEILEVKRQQRKVNFLITLPELYAHFMKNKMGSSSLDDEDTNNILKQLEDDGPMPSSSADDYDCEAMKAQALKTAQEAYSNQQARLNQFSGEQNEGICLGGGREAKEHPQPRIFKGILKSYQMKGMNWLANLYYFGINGILADEMGLGKTVQSIAFLAHICEQYDTWGPFLIITPASTLHNWTGEIARFVPSFQVVPYWGNPEERKNLRKFFDGKNLGTREASFHVVVTSYQIVIQDFKFLNRLKWNYMVLDEAQAIKSINSQRWKLLLGFSCRNRLLLSGTPIQNSMAELWALLHFIMPSLFDSHLWFNEWFSKDIEGHVENKTHVDEKHLNRLHMILKPFMLRRVKTEVENELTDKIEIMMYCPLTLRQKFLYNGLKNKISIDELLRSSMGPSSQQSSVTSSLMNLVMQFRKVCNHPELLERREVRSPFTMHPNPYVIPKLVFRESLIDMNSSKHHLLYNKLSIFNPEYIHSTLTREEDSQRTCFSFLRFIDVSPHEMSEVFINGLEARCLLLVAAVQYAHIRYLRKRWSEKDRNNGSPTSKLTSLSKDLLIVDPNLCSPNVQSSSILSDLVFTSFCSSVYTFTNHVIHYIPETMNHRIMRSKKERAPLIEELPENLRSNSDNEDLQINQVKIEPKEEISFPEEKMSPSKNTSPQRYQLKIGSPSKSGSSHKSSHKRPSSGSKHSSRRHNIKSRDEHFLQKEPIIGIDDETPSGNDTVNLLPEFPHIERPPETRTCLPTQLPTFLMHTCPKAQCLEKELFCHDRSAAWWQVRCHHSDTAEGLTPILYGSGELERDWMERRQKFTGVEVGGLRAAYPKLGWSRILIPDKHSLIMDAGKLYVLDSLLKKLKAGGHRVLIYSQMTKMIDLLEEYMWHRKHKYMRLDGSSKISDRRDMVADFQTKADIFVFLLSTRAGGVGINLTAADTVIFYDSDWNPTVDQQAMDRAHRLGQTKQVTVYRLVCKATIEERILQRAREKSEIQRMVISGGNFKPDTLKPKEVVSLLLDDDIEKQYRARQQERRILEEHKIEVNREKMRERMRKRYAEKKWEREQEEKRRRIEEGIVDIGGGGDTTPLNSTPASPTHSEVSVTTSLHLDDGSNDGSLIVDVESPAPSTPVSLTGGGIIGGSNLPTSSSGGTPIRGQRKRGRPKGSTLRGRLSRSADGVSSSPASSAVSSSVGVGGGSSSLPGSGSPGSGNSGSPVGSNGAGGSGLPMKRGRGRPRLLPLGPGHQGTRTPPALPLALGTTLNTPKPDDNSQKPFGFYT